MSDTSAFYQPIPGNVIPRFAGMVTFMRLPHVTDLKDIDIGLVGVPWDGGTTNRAGARHGPRQVREASVMMRNIHHTSGIRPFEWANCADLGDVPTNPIDIMDSLKRIEEFYTPLKAAGVTPLSIGGDHLSSLPILRALAKDGPVGMVHFDAHNDTWDSYFGTYKYTHGTPFRRAIEEGLLDPHRVVQIGIRGALYAGTENDWGKEQGVREITIEQVHDMGIKGTIEEARRIVGDGATYLSFDIDSLDPAFAPGTGTPEVGGFTSVEAQRLLRGMQGLNLIGADMVEVAPPFDPSGTTALVGATMAFEILCLLADARKRRRG